MPRATSHRSDSDLWALGRLTVVNVLAVVAVVATTACARDVSTANPTASPPTTVTLAHASATPSGRANTAPASATAPEALGEAPPPPPTPWRIHLQPLGAELPEVDVAFVERSLRAFYHVDIERLERIPLPDSARNDAKTRYRAEKLLDILKDRLPPGEGRMLGLTGVDISTTKEPYPDWGILGLATLDGRVCVISKFRTGRGAAGAEHARIRLGKVAVHEIGHNLGLEHCPNVGCLMEDARGTVLTCDREYDLCGECRARLANLALPSDPTRIPWPAPR